MCCLRCVGVTTFLIDVVDLVNDGTDVECVIEREIEGDGRWCRRRGVEANEDDR